MYSRDIRSSAWLSVLVLAACGGDAGGGDGAVDGAARDAAPPPCVGDCPPRARVVVTPARIPRGDDFATVVTLDASGSEGPNPTFEWSIPDARLEPGSSATDAVVRARLPGTADHGFGVVVRNAFGEDSTAGAVIVNRPPVAELRGGGIVAIGAPATLDGSESFDPDDDPITHAWRIVSAPVGSTASVAGSSASVALTPDRPGDYVVELVVNDGIQDGEPARLVVVGEPLDLDPPRVTVTATPPVAPVGTTFRVCVSAVDDSAIASRRASVDGADVPLGGDGCGDHRPTAAGRYVILGYATDAWDNTGRASAVVHAHTGTDDGPPRVALTGPADLSVLTVPTDAIGTADDGDLAAYWLEAAPEGTTAYHPFHEGRARVVSGVLGSIDPRALPPGAHHVRVCAEDTFGNRACSAERTYLTEAPARPGTLRMGFLDVQLDVIGIPLDVRRVYDSRARRTSSDFGHGWSLEADWRGTFSGPAQPGRGWRDTGCTVFPFRATIAETGTHRFVVTMGRRRFAFRMRVTGRACITGAAEVDVSFQAEPGTTGAFSAVGVGTTGLYILHGSDQILDSDFSDWSPTRFTLTLADGTRYEMQLGRGLTAAVDPTGARLELTTDGVRHPSGAFLRIDRDGAGRVERIALPDGRERGYRYDAAGDLVASTDYAGVTTRYRYGFDHELLQVVDPRGYVPGTLEYDADGRVVAVVDPSGRRIELAHDEAAGRTAVTDRLGNTTVYTYDEHGNLTSVLDALGNETRFEHDASGDLIARTDPLGNVTRFERDGAGRMTALVDPMGNRTELAYDAADRLTTLTDPTGRARTWEYDSNGRLGGLVDAAGGRTSFGYDATGAMTSLVDPLGSTVTVTRDTSGRMTGYTDPVGRAGRVTTRMDGQIASEVFSFAGADVRYDYAFDTGGRMTGVTLPNGARSDVTYDAAGTPIEAIDTTGGRQRLLLDGVGDVRAVRGADDGVHDLSRDAEGRVTALTLPDGRVIARELDALGRPLGVRMPDGTRMTSGYDAAGNVIAHGRAAAGTTALSYDAAGRVVASRAPDGATTRFEYDAAGRQTAVVDGAGARTELVYDARGDLIETRHPDGTTSRIERDPLSRPIAITDEAGRTMQMNYDAAGQLVETTDGAGGTFEHTYDEIGGLASATTPEGNVWSLSHDATGQPIARTFPWGATERFERDSGGRIVRTVDGTGASVDYQYDPVGRLVRRGDEAREYTRGGQLSVARGAWGTTSYVYDGAGRIARVLLPGGHFVEHTYDDAGRRAAVRTPSGTTRYRYDESSRIVEVDDSAAGRASYAYDAAGRVGEMTMPDGSTTRYERDARGRVTRIRVTRAGATLRDERYRYGAAGDPLEITDEGGATQYEYDGAGRVVRERRGERDIAYAYDGDWSLTRIGGRTLTVDRTRLVSDGARSYSHDAAGRRTGSDGGGVREQLTWDALGRLVRVERVGGAPAVVELSYDDSGLLRRAVVDGRGRTFVWDTTDAVPRLLEERGDDGALLARYVHGLGPLARVAGAETLYLHRDALSSVRLVTRADGGEAGRARYTAYGERADGTAEAGLGFAGELTLPGLGLVYLRNRWYDPATGRFLSPDPAPQRADVPTSFNPYLYAAGNPVRFRDPLGTFSLGQVAVASAIINVLVGIALPHFPHPVAIIARGLGLTEADAQVGFSLALALSWKWATGGLQIDYLRGPSRHLFVLWFFIGGQIGTAYGDPRLDSPTLTFWGGPILGVANDEPSDPRAGVYVLVTGTLASMLTNLNFKGGDRNRRVQPSWSRAAAGIQWEVLGVDRNGDIGSSFFQAFTCYTSDWGGLDLADKIKLKHLAMQPRRVWSAGIAFTVYLPLLWWSNDQGFDWIGGYFGDLY